MPKIKTIRLAGPFRTGTVNCYLVETSSGYILIDTGSSNQRAGLESELARAGCTPGTLDLVVLTHGDFDHTGNAAYLRKRYGTRIAMHAGDAGMAERGDIFSGRTSGSALFRLASPLLAILFGFGRGERFTPDLTLGEGSDLAEYGLQAKVLSLPGHSKGSIGILTASGDLFCGDLFGKTGQPVLNDLMDDLAAGKASVDRLQGLHIRTVYPGHGEPFSMERSAGPHG